MCDRMLIFWDDHFMLKDRFHIQNPSIISIEIVITKLAHMLNGYDICFNTTNYSIFKMQKFQILDMPLHFGLLWSRGTSTLVLYRHTLNIYTPRNLDFLMLHSHNTYKSLKLPCLFIK